MAKVKAKKGLSEEVIRLISASKAEPEWMLTKRLEALKLFKTKPLPNWGPDLSGLNFDSLTYYINPFEEENLTWEKVPSQVKKTYQSLGIPEAEQRYLAGVVNQYESAAFYHSLKKIWEKQGVIFCDLDEAVKKYPEIVKKHFMTDCVPAADNKFSALHGAVWSGGSFVYVPKGVKVNMPLQTYFYMHSKAFGQFEHTLIVAEEGSSLSYIEGCSAPRYGVSSLHSAVVEIYVKSNARVSYTSIQNWSGDIYNLNTKRAKVFENGQMEWINGSFGAGVSMLYPCSLLLGRGASSKYRGISIANANQIKDGGAKVFHLAPETKSEIISKSISVNGGKAMFRGLIKVNKGAAGSRAKMRCESLVLDEKSESAACPNVKSHEPNVLIAHEATVGRIEDEQLFYLETRGITKKEAESMIIHGFFEPVVADMPLEYMVELDKLIDTEMEPKDEAALLKNQKVKPSAEGVRI